MASSEEIVAFIGWDSREQIASDVAAHSINRHTHKSVTINYLKHRELRKAGLFRRPWQIDAETGNFRDLIDSKPFSTEFSHTRFLVPHIMKYKGWALFMDADMIFTSDIKDLWAMRDDRYAVMCVKHNHNNFNGSKKMDGRDQLRYHRKNWSSFVLFNCEHSANKKLTPSYVNFALGGDMHAFSWLDDDLIGSIPFRYNYISGVSPCMPVIDGKPDIPMHIHYTDGGPWFKECVNVPYADLWMKEYEDWQREADHGVIDIPATIYDRKK